MEAFVEIVRNGLFYFVEIASTLLEIFGVAILLYTGLKCFIAWVRRREDTGLVLAEAIALSLEFLLAAEVMHTVLADEVSDLIILGTLVVLRAAMTFEIHWELKQEKQNLDI